MAEKMTPKSVFSFSCPYEYLKHVWECKKKSNPSFSVRAWSRDLGLTSNTTLSLLLNKKRSFTKGQAVRFIDNLSLTSEEADYFEALIDYSTQSTLKGREFFKEKLSRLKKTSKIRGRELDTFKYFSSPLVLLIFEMVGTKAFRNNSDWIRSHLHIEASKEEIESAIDVLKNLSLIVEEKEGRLVKQQASVHFEFKEKIDDPSLIYHRRVLEMFKSRIGKNDNRASKASSYFFNIEKKNAEEARKTLDQFIDSFISRFESPVGSGDQTYQFGIYFMPFSKEKAD